MRILIRVVVGVVALAVIFVAVTFGASEFGGEIVTLETSDAEGGTAETRLWVIDHGGAVWLRAGVPTSGWLIRIEQNDAVRVTRANQARRYRAVPVYDPAVRDAVHRGMLRKYGWAEQLIATVRDGSQSVPVRLDPENAS